VSRLASRRLAIEPEKNLLHAVLARGRWAKGLKAGLLENANRADIRPDDIRVERPPGLVSCQELRDCGGGNSSAPILLPEPVCDQALAVLFPARDVTRDSAIHLDSPGFGGRLSENLGPPMRDESIPFSTRKRGHSSGVGIPLVFEKYRQIVLEYVPQHLLLSTYLEIAPAMPRVEGAVLRAVVDK
jgi:hypothetical protein